ncbi:hypothetical protein GGQ88_001457 [Novosphingobium hassiacum]|uniref:Uncharacterized protein n=1 Tax=Novosphingobium hassiacum TaxID=173676 RepID=A0A7W5ZUH5_9SPHN|nr:hypothetical protein [Novosphingobium hassiacum]
MGNQTAIKERNLEEPGRYLDCDGLMFDLTGLGKGSCLSRIQITGHS